jgi:dienelactone hydrolase
MGWITTAGSWDSVSKYLNATVDMLKAKGVTKFGVFGFCWGAYIAMTAGKEATYSFVGGAHPSLLGKAKEISEPVQVPVILISCKEDPMEEVKEVTDKKPFASKCFYQRFDDQVHGFLGARGNYKDATVASRAGEAVELIANFAKSRF